MNNLEPCSTHFPYASHFFNAHGSNLHYIDTGIGSPIVFLHGMPVSNYVWRNILPAFTERARCLAPDLMGMGKSDKPDILYSIFDHIDYITAWLNALNLKNITFVLHGWGSLVGFYYAMNNPDKIKALAFYEAHIRPIENPDMLSLPVQQFASLLKSPGSKRAIIDDNYLIKKMLPRASLRPLPAQALQYYAAPFKHSEDRRVLWQYTQDLPKGQGDSKVLALVREYSEYLQSTSVPKLLLYAMPGFITPIDTIQWACENFSNLQVAEVGEALHFAQETNPQLFSQSLLDWYTSL